VRHRPVSYSQESQRYCAYRDQLQVIQPWHYNDLPEIIDKYTAKKYKNWLLWKSSMEQIERTYKELAGTKDSPNERPEQARSVLPNCTATRIVVTTTVPEWQFIFNLRTSKAAYPPIRHLLEPIRDIFIEKGWVV
jgi:thymidylate synthase (FAD)